MRRDTGIYEYDVIAHRDFASDSWNDGPPPEDLAGVNGITVRVYHPEDTERYQTFRIHYPGPQGNWDYFDGEVDDGADSYFEM